MEYSLQTGTCMKRLDELDAKTVHPITALILDVDGVLTTGAITYLSSGEEMKSFHVRDGSGLKYWRRAGHVVAFLTGRSSPIVERRAEELGVLKVVMGAKDKSPGFDEILAELRLRPEQCAYVGDDLPDIPVLRRVGLGIAVADAVDEVKDAAAAVTERSGGCGAVREVVEAILKAQQRWDGILARYFEDGAGGRSASRAED